MRQGCTNRTILGRHLRRPTTSAAMPETGPDKKSARAAFMHPDRGATGMPPNRTLNSGVAHVKEFLGVAIAAYAEETYVSRQRLWRNRCLAGS